MEKLRKTLHPCELVALVWLAAGILVGISACGSKAHSADAGTPGTGGSSGHDAGRADAGNADAGQAGLKWFLTCGYPVCGAPGLGDAGTGAPRCTGEKAGAACSTRNQTCDPSAGCGENLLCTDHDPRMQPGGCPISRAEYKRDIAYLGPSELRRYADQLLDMPLATFRYKDDPSGRTQLGFVIEDVEPNAPESVDAARDRVDLYGYASMAAAALKVQDRELVELREKLRGLEGRLQAVEAECSRQRHASDRARP